MNLYTLPAEYAAWLAACEDAGGEVTPELEAHLEAIQGTLADKVDAVCALIRGARAEEDACRAEASWLTRKARVAGNRADRLRALLLRAMKALGIDHLQSKRFTVDVRQPVRARIRWTGDGEIPQWCQKVTVELDSDKARKGYLESGAAMEGFTVDFPEYLTIR